MSEAISKDRAINVLAAVLLLVTGWLNYCFTQAQTHFLNPVLESGAVDSCSTGPFAKSEFLPLVSKQPVRFGVIGLINLGRPSAVIGRVTLRPVNPVQCETFGARPDIGYKAGKAASPSFAYSNSSSSIPGKILPVCVLTPRHHIGVGGVEVVILGLHPVNQLGVDNGASLPCKTTAGFGSSVPELAESDHSGCPAITLTEDLSSGLPRIQSLLDHFPPVELLSFCYNGLHHA